MTYLKKIEVKTSITLPEGETEEIIQRVEGSLYIKDNHYYLRYNEANVEELGQTTTTIKVMNNKNMNQEVVIIRQGNIRMKQTLKKDHIDLSYYYSPVGTLEMQTIAKKVNVEIDEKYNGKVSLIYELSLNQALAGEYSVNVSFKD